MTREELDHVAIPKWFMRVVTVGVSLIGLIGAGAVPWAWGISNSIAVIQVQLASEAKMQAAEVQEIRRRVESVEEEVDQLDERMRKAGN